MGGGECGFVGVYKNQEAAEKAREAEIEEIEKTEKKHTPCREEIENAVSVSPMKLQ